ncbi:actin cytoskeleton-regulatory complex protein pan1-like [Cynara cardunculus var. scolymus]|uniref:actin cytoskeleton-regulatory complex protein pan1-like n=1 Tax=Cynara cardunculus var. scolymus TaxID=59895 RepID=UPI000D62F154|nr:actin cytoskeleton-regulatory complex protein pan1-like [Cynara cardunculus var. scolymus]
MEKERMSKEKEDRAERARLEEIARVQAEEERVERARQAKIARLKEEERIRAEEKATRGLEHFSSSDKYDDQEHFGDVSGSNTTSEESEEEEEEEDDDDEEGGGEAEPEQPRMLNRHIYFPSPTPRATTSSDSSGQDIEIIETERDGASPSSHDAQALIPLNVPVDYVTQSAMNTLDDPLLKKVANFTLDYNSKATEAAESIRRSLTAFSYHTDMEILRVSDAAEEILKLFEEKIKSMPQAEEQRPKRIMEPSVYASTLKRMRLDDDEDPDMSGPQSRQERETPPTAAPSVTPRAAPSAFSASAPSQPAPKSSRREHRMSQPMQRR